MRTYLFVALGIAGLVMNILVEYARVSENVLGSLVFASMILIVAGFVPGLRNWPHARVANVVMCIALALYMARAITTVVQYALTRGT
jgi:hypothetical protein